MQRTLKELVHLLKQISLAKKEKSKFLASLLDKKMEYPDESAIENLDDETRNKLDQVAERWARKVSSRVSAKDGQSSRHSHKD